MNCLHSNRRGFTLIETMTAIAVSGMVFGFLGFLIFFSARSSINLHQQSISQINAGKASERISNLVRNATGFSLCETDVPTNLLTRVYVEYPWTPTEVTTHTLAAVTLPSGKKQIRYYTHKVESWDDGEPDDDLVAYEFGGLDNFSLSYQSANRLFMTISYVYKGFAMVFENPGMPQHGDYVTECIAKNHFLGQGVDNYVDATFAPIASLY